MWCFRCGATLCCAAVVIVGCGELPEPSAPAVVESALVGATPDTDHPGVVAIGITMGGMEGIGCTGTLVAPDLVLTALHCTAEVAGTVGDAFCGPTGTQFTGMFVVFGENLKTGITQRLDVAEIMTPCNDPCGCDMALLRLNGVAEDPTIAYEPRLEGPIAIGEAMTAVGYGKVTETISGEGVRRSRSDINVSCLGVQCGGLNITNNEFGTENVACGGDSGGPIFDVQNRLAGILSRSTIPCEAPFGLAVYGSPRTRADWLVNEAVAAAERAGHPAPVWAGGGADVSVCEEAGRCGMNKEWDGRLSDCGACPAGQTCGFVGLCEGTTSSGGNFDPDDPWFGDGSSGAGAGIQPSAGAGATGGMDALGTGGVMATMTGGGKNNDDGCSAAGAAAGSWTPALAVLCLARRRRRVS